MAARIKTILVTVIMLIAAISCTKEIESRLDDLESRVSVLEQIAESSKNGDFIKSVSTITENSEIIGYHIEFQKGNPINVYFGKDGKDGVDGKNGDSLFQSVTVTDTEVTFVTVDGQTFIIRRAAALIIEFDTADLVVMGTDATRDVHYSITSDVDDITIEALSSADIKAKVVKTDSRTGVLQVKTGVTIDEYSKVVVLVSNSIQAIMRTLSFEKEAIEIEENTTKEVTNVGGEVTLEFFTGGRQLLAGLFFLHFARLSQKPEAEPLGELRSPRSDAAALRPLPPFPASSLRENLSPAGPVPVPVPGGGHVPQGLCLQIGLLRAAFIPFLPGDVTLEALRITSPAVFCLYLQNNASDVMKWGARVISPGYRLRMK